MQRPTLRRWIRLTIVTFVGATLSALASAQDVDIEPAPSAGDEPARVEVRPVAQDEEIRNRLLDILRATEWFTGEGVSVQNGVVFLEGRARTEEHKVWAGSLARNTSDVAAVVNQMDVAEPPVWDFRPAMAGLRALGPSAVRSLPLLALSAIILVMALLSARAAAALARHFFRRRSPPLFFGE